MKAMPGTLILAIALAAVFGIEIEARRVGDETALLALGALPANGQLHGEYSRLITYAFLHLNWQHILLNLALLLWVGRIVEKRIGTARLGLIYFVSVLLSGLTIFIKYAAAPSQGSAVGASGGIFGLLAAALVLVYRKDMAEFSQDTGLRTGLWICFVIGIGMSFLPGVSLAGHLGGLIAGLVLGFLITKKDERAWFRIGRRES
jgi:membrane associated rhomboid family serine protease